jgi:hypothetical protein
MGSATVRTQHDRRWTHRSRRDILRTDTYPSVDKRTRRLLATLLVLSVGSVAVGAEWRSTTELTVSETASGVTLVAGGQQVDSLGTDGDVAVTSVESGRSTLAAVYVPNSSVQRTELTVVWSLPDGLWHSTRVEIRPTSPQRTRIHAPTLTTYSDTLVVGSPSTVDAGPGLRVDYPLGAGHGRIDTLVTALEPASDGTVRYEVRLTARSVTGRSVDTSLSFNTSYGAVAP